jgi:hypothetical protein
VARTYARTKLMAMVDRSGGGRVLESGVEWPGS